MPSSPDAPPPAPEAPLPPAEPAPAAPPPGARFRTLDPRVTRLWQLRALLWTVGLSAASLTLWLALDRHRLALLPLLLVLAGGAAGVLWWAPSAWRAWRWRVGEEDVRLEHGVLWRTVSLVAHARVQHVDTRRGPVERLLGLATVVIFTAGSVGAALALPGLPAAEAERLRDELVARGGGGDAV